MQVLSETISKALQLTGGPEATETVRFISMFDKFFDCVNVANLTSGRFKRKVFQQPYRSGEDFRLKVLFTCNYSLYCTCTCACMCVIINNNNYVDQCGFCALSSVAGDRVFGILR